jgi:hypothetical protein
MSTDSSNSLRQPQTLVGAYLSWYIGCFQTGDS